MVFSSNVFLLYFMPVFFLVYFILPRKARNYFLLLASLLFYRAYRVVFCGVPYSRAFLTRCAAFSAEGTLECCFCPKDIETDINILKCFAGNRPEEEREAFLSGTLQKLLDVKQALTEPE